MSIIDRLTEMEKKATAGPWTEWDNPVNGGEMNPDCQLMVALRNAAPALLDVAKAAQTYLHSRSYTESNAAIAALRSALSALEEGK